MSKGYFISIEGPDGSGKSTQIENIKKYFEERKIDTVFTREPGGTAIGERIREIILDNNCKEMSYMTEAMLYAASRAQHVEQIIRPALASGKVVICDRFVDSSIAYQGFGRKLVEQVKVINDFAVDGCMPNITFLFELDPRIGKHRINQSSQDRLESEKDSFHLDVYNGYLKLKEMYPDRIIGIDASQSIESIRNQIYAKLDSVVKELK